MNRDELLRLIDSGDLYGLMLMVNRAWLERYHPTAPHAALVTEMGERTPPHTVVILPRPTPE